MATFAYGTKVDEHGHFLSVAICGYPLFKIYNQQTKQFNLMSDIKNVVWERTLIGEPMRYWTAKTEAEAEQVRQNYNEKYGAEMQLCTEEEWVRLRTEWNGFEPYEITAEAYYQLRDGVPPMSMTGSRFVCGEPHDHDEQTGRPIHSVCYRENGKYYTKLIKI